jgi:hypothetical protein
LAGLAALRVILRNKDVTLAKTPRRKENIKKLGGLGALGG